MQDKRIDFTAKVIARQLCGANETSVYASAVIRSNGGLENSQKKWVKNGFVDIAEIRKAVASVIDRTDRKL